MPVGDWRNILLTEEGLAGRKFSSRCHFLYHKSHIDWPEIAAGPVLCYVHRLRQFGPSIQLFSAFVGPCHHGMARPQVADG